MVLLLWCSLCCRWCNKLTVLITPCGQSNGSHEAHEAYEPHVQPCASRRDDGGGGGQRQVPLVTNENLNHLLTNQEGEVIILRRRESWNDLLAVVLSVMSFKGHQRTASASQHCPRAVWRRNCTLTRRSRRFKLEENSYPDYK